MADVKTYGLVGKGISYSLSPAMHNAAFRHFNIPAEYKLFDIEEDALDEFFQKRVLGGEISGFNVTVPYKVRMKDILEKCGTCSMDEDAKVLGAVNTIKVEKEGLFGFNTDGKGFTESLIEDAGFYPKDRSVFILGAGGAGRAICLYLASDAPAKPGRIRVFDVDGEKLSELSDIFVKNFGEGFLEVVEEGALPEKMGDSDLLVNATPLGTKEGSALPVDPDLLHEGMTVYDLVYSRETELIKAAKEKGLTACGGKGMLANQGALAFSIWTGKPLADVKQIMHAALNLAT